jgi:hypothetical protein
MVTVWPQTKIKKVVISAVTQAGSVGNLQTREHFTDIQGLKIGVG